MNTTRVTPVQVQRECYTSVKWTTRVRHKWNNFDFDNGTSKNIFTPLYLLYSKWRLQGEQQFHSKNYLLEIPHPHAKMRLKSAPQKLNFLMAKVIQKFYKLNCSLKCPCTFPRSYAFLRHLLFGKNHFMWNKQHFLLPRESKLRQKQ